MRYIPKTHWKLILYQLDATQNDVWFAEEDEEKMMVVEAFVLFFPVALELNGGS